MGGRQRKQMGGTKGGKSGETTRVGNLTTQGYRGKTQGRQGEKEGVLGGRSRKNQVKNRKNIKMDKARERAKKKVYTNHAKPHGNRGVAPSKTTAGLKEKKG